MVFYYKVDVFHLLPKRFFQKNTAFQTTPILFSPYNSYLCELKQKEQPNHEESRCSDYWCRTCGCCVCILAQEGWCELCGGGSCTVPKNEGVWRRIDPQGIYSAGETNTTISL